jgi:hypothetical protein
MCWKVTLMYYPKRANSRASINAALAFSTLLCVATMLLLQGCQYDPYAHTFTTDKPQTNAVVGRYVLKDQTLVSGGLAAMHGRPCVVELAADGTFVATNVPPGVFGAPPISSLNSLVSGKGTWQLASVGGVDNGTGKIKTHWGVHLESQAPQIDSPGFTGDRPPYGLIFTVGDPDSGTVMLLERAK